MGKRKKTFAEQLAKVQDKEDVVEQILHVQTRPAETPPAGTITIEQLPEEYPPVRTITISDDVPEPKDKGYQIKVRKKEPRNRRLQLLVTKSLYSRIEREAKRLDVSVNELVNTILDDVIK